jgi:hypothetical protein
VRRSNWKHAPLPCNLQHDSTRLQNLSGSTPDFALTGVLQVKQSTAMKPILRFFAATILAATLTTPLLAQQPPKPKSTSPIAERRIDVNLGNSTIAEAAEEFRQSWDGLNVIVPPSVADLPIGPLQLRQITIENLCLIIPAATDRIVEATFDRDAFLTFRPTVAIERTQPICRIMSLTPYLAGKPEKDAEKAIVELQDAVVQACSLLAKARRSGKLDQPDFSVHQPTKLLIVVGSPESVNIVEGVVNALSGGPAPGTSVGAGAGDVSGVPGPFGRGAAPVPTIPGLDPIPTAPRRQ